MRDPIGAALSALRRVPRPQNLSSVPYVGHGVTSVGLMSGLRSGGIDQAAQMTAYGSNGTLFGIVSRLATATAKVDWRLWRKAVSGLKEDRVEVTRHAVLDLLSHPNNFFTQRELIETCEQHVDLTGEAWIIVPRAGKDKGLPLELWPVRPDRMRPVADREKFILRYEYLAPSGEVIPLGVGEVMRIRMPDPLDPYRGLGPVQGLLRTLDTAKYSEEWNRNFFLNSAEPGGIIEYDHNLSDDEFTTLSMRWAEQHKGVANAHRVAMIEAGKWVNRTFTMRDMQFAELAAVGDDKIRKAFGFPQFALGDVKDVNRASAIASKAFFAEELTIPRLDRFKDMFNAYLLPMFPTTAGLELDYEDPVPPDAEARDRERNSKADAAKALIDAHFDGASVVEALGLPDSLIWVKPIEGTPPLQIGATAAARQRRPVVALTSPGVAGVDLSAVQAQWSERLRNLVDEWVERIELEWRDELRGQIVGAISAGNVATLGALDVDTLAGVSMLGEEMVHMWNAASVQMSAEADMQGVSIEPSPSPGGLGGGLAPVASGVVALLGASMALAAGREALRLFVPGSGGSDAEAIADSVDTYLQGLAGADRNVALGGALTRAQNGGRIATLRNAENAGRSVTYYASEVLDRNTCGPCKAINGDVLPTLDAAVLAYGAGGGYLLCEGRERCRGTVVAVWNKESDDA